MRISVWLSVLLLLSGLSLLLGLDQAIAGGGTVEGFVYARNYLGDYRQTGWANITATGGALVYTAQFNAGGHYFMILPAGTYTITASLPGYDVVTKTVSVSDGSATRLDFRLEQSGVPIPEFHQYATPLVVAVSLLLVMISVRKRTSVPETRRPLD